MFTQNERLYTLTGGGDSTTQPPAIPTLIKPQSTKWHKRRPRAICSWDRVDFKIQKMFVCPVVRPVPPIFSK